MKQGILIRVAIDSTYGNWNAPVNPNNGDFVYMPIPENPKHQLKPGHNFPYDHYISTLKSFSYRNKLSDMQEIRLPNHLRGLNTHLDPDFNFLTYGDNGDHRGKELKQTFNKGDFIVFYAGLKPIINFSAPLYYAIIGFYIIEKVLEAKDVAIDNSINNAHTRKVLPNPNDVVIIANPRKSGRLEKCILIGEYRDRAYRIQKELLARWGGITANDGYLQRSAVLPRFNNPDKFLEWFSKQNAKLIHRNN